jgi:hypothetical protein
MDEEETGKKIKKIKIKKKKTKMNKVKKNQRNLENCMAQIYTLIKKEFELEDSKFAMECMALINLILSVIKKIVFLDSISEEDQVIYQDLWNEDKKNYKNHLENILNRKYK